MLRVIPESALVAAREGIVVPASALSLAGDAEAVLAFARRRAQALLAQAEVDCEEKRREAMQQGYADGFSVAAQAFSACLSDLTTLQERMTRSIVEQAQQALRQHCSTLGFSAQWLAHWCELRLAEDTSALVVHVPSTLPDLAQSLRNALPPRSEVQLTEVEKITIEQGSLVFEFDPVEAIFGRDETAVNMLDHVALATRIAELSKAYVNDLLAAQQRRTEMERFMKLGAPT
jgi:hypothetical protein